MEFSVSKSALLNELTTTQGVVERKTTIPILSNLLVEAKGEIGAKAPQKLFLVP
jgi:DNA polymerase-3 subunit beta